jgi:predicted Rossmann fold nucleotide-binding protein DprA/Smf involved in DNA uptake
MKIVAPNSVREGVNSTMAKTHSEKVLAKVGKKPKTATQIGQQLGFPSHHGVSKALGQAVKSGQVVKTDKGYQKAA